MTLEEVKRKMEVVGSHSNHLQEQFISHLSNQLDETEVIIDFLECGHKGCEAILVPTSCKVLLIWRDNSTEVILFEKIQYTDILKVEFESFLWQKDLRVTTKAKCYYLLDVSETSSNDIVDYIWQRRGENEVVREKDENLLSMIFENMDQALNEATSEIGIEGEVFSLENDSKERYAKEVVHQKTPIEKFFYGLAELRSFNSREIGKLIEEFPALLREGEAPKHGAKGRYKDTYNGLLVATNQRIMVLYLGNKNLNVLDKFEYRIDDFVDVDSDALLGGTIEFDTGACFSFDHPETAQYYELCQYLIEKVCEKSKQMEVQDEAGLESEQMASVIIPEVAGISSIEKMRQLNIAIEDKVISDYLDELEMICQDIFTYVEKNPNRESEIKDFVDDYLPKTFRLLQKYDDLSTRTLKTKNINHAMEEITQVLGVIVEAIKNLYDRIYENEALQISREVKVLKDMLAQNGLMSETSPFELKK